jgi:hypothetical protein
MSKCDRCKNLAARVAEFETERDNNPHEKGYYTAVVQWWQYALARHKQEYHGDAA